MLGGFDPESIHDFGPQRSPRDSHQEQCIYCLHCSCSYDHLAHHHRQIYEPTKDAVRWDVTSNSLVKENIFSEQIPRCALGDSQDGNWLVCNAVQYLPRSWLCDKGPLLFIACHCFPCVCSCRCHIFYPWELDGHSYERERRNIFTPSNTDLVQVWMEYKGLLSSANAFDSATKQNFPAMDICSAE